MKLLIFAVLLPIMQAAPPIPRQTSDKAAEGRSSIQNKANGKQIPSPSPTPVQPLSNPTPDQNTGQQPSQNNAPEAVIVRELPAVTVATDGWNRWYVIFTGILVAVGCVGARLAYRSLRSIERQGKTMEGQQTTMNGQLQVMRDQLKAMEEQIALQEVQLRQWVDIQNWRVTRQIRADGKNVLKIKFDIVNPTKMVLTLEVVTTTIVGQGFALRQRISLTPQSHQEGDAVFRLTEEQNRQFMNGGLVLPINGAVWFTDAMKRAQEWHIRGMLNCNNTWAEFIRTGELIEEGSTEDDEQRPEHE